MTTPLPRDVLPWSEQEFEARLRERESGYHIHHPFNQRLNRGELVLAHGEPIAEDLIVSGPRVGVAYAGEAAAWLLRFAVQGNPHVSRPRLARD